METKTKSCDAEFLSEVYKAAKIGSDTLSMPVEKLEDAQMRTDLQKQQQEYCGYLAKVTQELAHMNEVPEDNGAMKNAEVWTGVTFNTMLDKSPRHIAEMVIQGSNMGIVEMTKQLNKSACVSQDVKKIGQDLIRTEEKNVQRMKNYL